MRRNTLRAAVAAIVFGLGSAAVAQDNQPQQQLEQTKRQEQAEMQRQGDRKVEVREMALWSLGDLPPQLMHKAMERLSDDPTEARKAVMQAANIVELQASLAIQKAEAQAVEQRTRGQEQPAAAGARDRAAATGDERISSRDASREKGVGAYQAAAGGSWSETRDRGLWRAAQGLRELATRIEYRQALARDDLREPFARASLAMASFYQRAAEQGLQRQDEMQTGYTLKGAADYLAAAHAFGQHRPTAEASRAMFDAERLGERIVKLSKPTTVRNDQKEAAARGAGDVTGSAQTAAAREEAGAPQLRQEASKVIANLGDAIRQAEARQGVGGQDTGRPQDRRNEQGRREDQQQPQEQDRR